MIQSQTILTVRAARQGLQDITGDVAAWVADQPVADGLLTLYIRHTSASLLIQENYDPSVARDLETFFDRLAPEDESLYTHNDEGPDDMPAHIKNALTQTHLAVPVQGRRLLLGRYQGIYLFE
ncbi:MAG: secondary thiamine-phosphate synthase enzyme YjbQ, partial [Alphaproteobacteria bacterium]|nr:secondary thiamine-phosphate synthase enzyme YjbQ [Alphaproteobacteria bacterium]